MRSRLAQFLPFCGRCSKKFLSLQRGFFFCLNSKRVLSTCFCFKGSVRWFFRRRYLFFSDFSVLYSSKHLRSIHCLEVFGPLIIGSFNVLALEPSRATLHQLFWAHRDPALLGFMRILGQLHASIRGSFFRKEMKINEQRVPGKRLSTFGFSSLHSAILLPGDGLRPQWTPRRKMKWGGGGMAWSRDQRRLLVGFVLLFFVGLLVFVGKEELVCWKHCWWICSQLLSGCFFSCF